MCIRDRAYLARVESLGIALRDFDPTGRIVVSVTGTAGLPVAGADVEVSAAGTPIAHLRTTADGTARFHPALYGACLLYTSRAHETPEQLVCRLLLEKKNKRIQTNAAVILSWKQSHRIVNHN